MLSYFNPSTWKRIWDNYDSELHNYMLLQKSGTYQCYYYLDVINLFSRPYFTSANKELLKILIAAKVSISDIDALFSDQEQVNRLYTILSLKTIEVLVDKEIIKSRDDIESLYTTISDIQKEVSDLEIIGCDLLKILINKRFIQNVKDIGELLKKENLITNIQNNPYLTKTILNNDSLINALGTEGIVDLISHPKYAKSSNYLLKNCQLALALLSKGAIENITIDYLFDSEKIKNDLKNNEFIKNVELTDASDNVTSGMDEIIDGMFVESQNDPMPKLKDLSLIEFTKMIPSVGTRRT